MEDNGHEATYYPVEAIEQVAEEHGVDTLDERAATAETSSHWTLENVQEKSSGDI
jgi:hypothetical protein